MRMDNKSNEVAMRDHGMVWVRPKREGARCCQQKRCSAANKRADARQYIGSVLSTLLSPGFSEVSIGKI
jgi:hypothetical protein